MRRLSGLKGGLHAFTFINLDSNSISGHFCPPLHFHMAAGSIVKGATTIVRLVITTATEQPARLNEALNTIQTAVNHLSHLGYTRIALQLEQLEQQGQPLC